MMNYKIISLLTSAAIIIGIILSPIDMNSENSVLAVYANDIPVVSETDQIVDVPEKTDAGTETIIHKISDNSGETNIPANDAFDPSSADLEDMTGAVASVDVVYVDVLNGFRYSGIPKEQDPVKAEFDRRCNSDYGYKDIINNIKSDAMRELYEAIDAAEKDFFFGSADLSEDNPSIIIPKPETLSDDEVIQVFTLYRYDHPLYFWMSSGISVSEDQIGLNCDNTQLSYSSREATWNRIVDEIGEYEEYCEGSTSNYTYAAATVYLMTQKIDYAYDENGEPEGADWAHSIIGVFDDTYHLAVCEGYAKAYQLLMNYFGVPNVYVVGQANGNTGNSGEMVLHAWNMVQMDDGKYYWVDPTWSDVDLRFANEGYGNDDGFEPADINVTENIKDYPYRTRYTYFLKGNGFFDDHWPLTPDNTDFFYLYTLPETEDDRYIPTDIGHEPVENLNGYPTVDEWINAGDAYYLVTQNDGIHRTVEWRCNYSSATGIEEYTIPVNISFEGYDYDVIGVDLSGIDFDIHSVVISEGIKYIQGMLNYETMNTEYISIPSTVEFIGEMPLSHTAPLKRIDVSEDNPYIVSEDGILYNKDKTILLRYPNSSEITDYYVPDTVEHIYWFSLCWNNTLESIHLNGKETMIDPYSFREMKSLKSVEIPASVKLLPRMVFMDSDGIKHIYISKETVFSEETFSGCSAELHIEQGNPYGFTYDGAFYRMNEETKQIELCSYPKGRDADCVEVWEECQRIRESAFDGSGNIEKVIVPDNCFVDPAAFFRSNIASLEISENNTSVLYENGAILSPDGKELWTYLGGCKNETYTVPDTVKTIQQFAFVGNPYIKRIFMNDNVTDVLAYAFKDCTGLEYIDLSDNIAWNMDIEDTYHPYPTMNYYSGIFEGCIRLKEITIPAKTIHIPCDMFVECKSLNKVVIPEGVQTIGDCAFRTDAAISEFVVFSKDLRPAERTTYTYATDWTRSISDAPGSKSVQCDYNILYSVFDEQVKLCDGDITYVYSYKDSEIANYLLDENRIEIGEVYTMVFRDIEKSPKDEPDHGKCGDDLYWNVSSDGKTLTITGTGEMYNYVLNNTVEAPWMYRFGDSIENLVISEGAASVGEFAFFAMPKLKNVELPSSLSIVGSSAFELCNTLEEIVFPGNVELFDNYSFAFCKKLLKVEFLGSVKELRMSFIGCTSLKDVVFHDEVVYLNDLNFCGCNQLSELDLSTVKELGDLNFKLSGVKKIVLRDVEQIYFRSAFYNITADVYYGCKLNNSSFVGRNYEGNLNWIPLGHIYIATVIEPTEEAGGYTEHVCSVCGDSYQDNFTNPIITIPAVSGRIEIKGSDDISGTTVKISNSEGYEVYAEPGDDSTFNVKELPDGTYSVTVKKKGYAPRTQEITVKRDEPINVDFELYQFGDANDDSKTNLKDLVLLMRYLTNWGVDVDLFTCDLNGDGKINMKDLAFLQRLLNGWDIVFE